MSDTKELKKGFTAVFCEMMTDPVYLLLLFGTTFGTGAIGGQNVGMPQMLKKFGIDEEDTLTLATPGSIGAVVGLLAYTFYVKKLPRKILQFEIVSLMLCIMYFCFWASYIVSFYSIYAFKFGYSIFNGPSISLIMDIMLRYFKRAKSEEFVLIGSSLAGLFKHVQTAASSKFVGIMWKWRSTAETALLIGLGIQTAIAISVVSMTIVAWMLKKKGIDLETKLPVKKHK